MFTPACTSWSLALPQVHPPGAWLECEVMVIEQGVGSTVDPTNPRQANEISGENRMLHVVQEPVELAPVAWWPGGPGMSPPWMGSG